MTQILDPEVKPSPGKEFVHKGKGCLAVIVALGVLVFGGYFVFDRAHEFISSFGEVPDYTGAGKAAVTVTVPDGASLDQIGGILVGADVIKSTKAWDAAVQSEARATSVQAGRYIMKTQMAAKDALALLINPGESRVKVQFTIKEGLRLTQQLDALVAGTKIPRAQYQAALKNTKSLGLPSYAGNNPEGVLFPDTYELTSEATATSTLQQMVKEYKSVAADVNLVGQAKKLHRSPEQVLVVASILEREIRNPDDGPKAARVIYDRLDKGMNLGLDSTVIYAGNLKTNTTTPQDRANPSPYNTYIHKGLPPGPISAPGKAALEAAANPASGKWLYFVTVNYDTGETKFADTPQEFEKYRQEFVAWCGANPGKCDS